MASTAQSTSLAHVATDPLRNFKFKVTFSGKNPKTNKLYFANAMFMSVGGFNVTTEVIPYREGGMNTTTQKMPGQSDFSAITMTKGLIVGQGDSYDWMQSLFSVIQGEGGLGAGVEFRSTIDVSVLAHPVTNLSDLNAVPVKAAFRVYNAWPTSIAFSDLDAGANSIIVQQMTFAHEGFKMLLAKTAGNETVKF